VNRTRHHLRTRSGRAFTLVEVLTAILVLAITIPVIVQSYSSAAEIALMSRQRVEALAVGQSALDMLVATGDWQQGVMQGEETPGPTTYTWAAELNAWGDPSTETATVQQLTVTVSWTRSGQEFAVTLDTLVYLPDETATSTTGTIGGIQ
jgi:prepilin-type N-terminal cleavage/methylation domain-containing protein